MTFSALLFVAEVVFRPESGGSFLCDDNQTRMFERLIESDEKLRYSSIKISLAARSCWPVVASDRQLFTVKP